MLSTEDKFLEIYERNKNIVLKVVFDMTRDFHLAQDICQETFLKLYGYQDHIIEEKVRGWLLVVASNLVIDYRRKLQNRKEIPMNNTDEKTAAVFELEAVDTIKIYFEQMEYRQLCSDVLTALREKNQNWYEVMILVEYLGVPRKTVARNRQISLSTVDSYLRKSKKWMKENFQDKYKGL